MMYWKLNLASRDPDLLRHQELLEWRPCKWSEWVRSDDNNPARVLDSGRRVELQYEVFISFGECFEEIAHGAYLEELSAVLAMAAD